MAPCAPPCKKLVLSVEEPEIPDGKLQVAPDEVKECFKRGLQKKLLVIDNYLATQSCADAKVDI